MTDPLGGTPGGSPGDAFVAAVAGRDVPALRDALAPDVDFRGLTPNRSWEATTPDEVVDVVLGHWFEESDRITSVDHVEHGDSLGDVRRLAYRFSLVNDAGRHVVEQQVYYKVRDGRLAYLRVVCSGFQPVG